MSKNMDNQSKTRVVELRADLRRSGHEYLVTLKAEQLHGNPEATFSLDPQGSQEDRFHRHFAGQQTSEQFFRTVGSQLFESLFPIQHQVSYEINYQYVKEDIENRLLRIQLRMEDEEIIDLPWECLYNPVAKLWLAANPLTPLSRYVDAQAPTPLQVQPPLKLLIATAEPNTLESINAKAEVEAVTRALTPLLRHKLVTAKLLEHTTRGSLRRAMDEFRPHLFHFVGHGWLAGKACGLILEADDGIGEKLRAESLCELLRQSEQLRVAVLNARNTSRTALVLARAGIAAIGVQDKIRTQAAIPFCRSFYEAVSGSVPLDVAINRARFSIRLECGGDRRDWCGPTIFLPAGRADPFRIDRGVRLVRITSSPSKAVIFLDGVSTDKTTPETLVIKDNNEHKIHIALEGYKPSPPRSIIAEIGKPAHLDFLLAATPGFLVVSTDHPNAKITVQRHGDSQVIAIGDMERRTRLGPVKLQPGQYRVTASWAERTGQSALTAEDEITIRPNAITNAQTPFPSLVSLKRSRWIDFIGKREVKIAAGLVITVLLIATLAYFRLPNKKAAQPVASQPTTPPATVTPATITPIPPAPAIRMKMVTIPAGKVYLGYHDTTVTMRLIQKYGLLSGAALPGILQNRPRETYLMPYFIDRTEVTNAQYRKFLAAVKLHGDAAWKHPSQPANKTDHTPLAKTWNDSAFNGNNQPVIGVDWYDAYACAKWAGKRLPTEDEWELAARGTKRLAYPWGNTYDHRKCNQGKAPTRAPTPVGQFQGDRSPYGLWDMAGNVHEWTTTHGKKERSKQIIFRGGAWVRNSGDIYAVTFMRCYATKDVRDNDLGFRCVRNAKAGTSAPAGMISIPGGMVVLGGETSGLLKLLRSRSQSMKEIQKGFLSDPPRTEEMKAFRICRHEVTNAQYRRFLKAVETSGDADYRHPDQDDQKDHTPKFWDTANYNDDNKPVVGVDWYDAYAFARWASMRLPTADEWEYAARGSTKNLYPWGDEFSKTKCNGQEAPTRSPSLESDFPEDRSPTGVMGMGGNVMEWTVSKYKAGTEGTMLLKGGAWTAPCRVYATIYIRALGAPKIHRDKDVGFRCVQDIRPR